MNARIDYNGQLVTGEVLRSFLFLRRVKLQTDRGYCLVWIPKWRCLPRHEK